MTRHTEIKVVPFSAEDMFDLVADIERYPDFLPWCQGAKVYEQKGSRLKADLSVGFSTLSEVFTSLVTLERPNCISVDYGGGSLRYLKNQWRFRDRGPGRCEIEFFVDFKLKSPLLAIMMDVFFERAFLKMVRAFEDRAHEQYGMK
ncbi:MAG: type II toxin-antitoxin system RatA family toxin [Proteobacteria bacterium]|jgi:coenzyme Q-binding protein COQ10|nr:type II toxin-antitoxin system RatA family toxin [Alphaproteobacteria bacterium]NCC02716.1 type II toxin-antitoxin system RatA family toxin [Pseudomonadota bacterium]